MITEKIDLTMKSQIENIRIRNGGIASPFSFVSMYVWRDIVGEDICLEDNLFSIRYKDSNRNSWIFPVGGEADKEHFIEAIIKEGNPVLYYIREEDKLFLENKFPGVFRIVKQDDFDEYIYSVKEQIEIKGNRFHRLRNRINKLLNEYTLRCEPLCDDNLVDAIGVIEKWAADKYEVGNLGTRGDEIDEDALKRWKELELTGVVIYYEDEPISIAAGFYLSEEMYDVLICKASSRIHGLYYYTRRELIKSLAKECIYVDLEDDMGLEGLKNMKEELHPIGKIKMWKAEII